MAWAGQTSRLDFTRHLRRCCVFTTSNDREQRHKALVTDKIATVSAVRAKLHGKADNQHALKCAFSNGKNSRARPKGFESRAPNLVWDAQYHRRPQRENSGWKSL